MHRSFQLAAALALLAIASIASAAPCAGFNDLDATDALCRNVEWIKNRGITLGCGAGNYCPSQPVLRSQMAAFMNRLGTALTPEELWVDAPWGPADLDVNPVICQTFNYTVKDYPRRAFLDLSLAANAAANIDFAADLVMTVDAGATWTQMTAFSNRGSILASQYGYVSNLANADLGVGQSVRFGVRLSRVSGTADLTTTRCNLRVTIESRDGAAPPY